ncbi:MAG: chemotaxis protein CheB [Candidatus Obscuribacterales bacterium]|nr:chemotaxis protein CheB [Candidatus Obscuribacterales bacterium]
MTRSSKAQIKVLIVEDSPLMQQLLSYIFSQDPAFQVLACVDDAPSALSAVSELLPDLVTMDILLKRANGLELTRQIMESMPVPIVVISSSCHPGDTLTALEIVQAGALAAIPKPPAINHPDFPKAAAQLRQIARDMAAVKVVKRRSGVKTFTSLPLLPKTENIHGQYQVLAIGASTGGPPAVLALLKELSPKIALPVLLVQHIYPGFAAGLVEWLQNETPWKVELLSSSSKAQAGTVYLCENGLQMGIRADGQIIISKAKPDAHHCPSVSHLFKSAAEAYGPRAIGIILSGMGHDGAEELKLIREKGGMTIAQDQKSAYIYGMPGEAARINAAEFLLSPSATARLINQIFGLSKA